jgi:hypothetical protein
VLIRGQGEEEVVRVSEGGILTVESENTVLVESHLTDKIMGRLIALDWKDSIDDPEREEGKGVVEEGLGGGGVNWKAVEVEASLSAVAFEDIREEEDSTWGSPSVGAGLGEDRGGVLGGDAESERERDARHGVGDDGGDRGVEGHFATTTRFTVEAPPSMVLTRPRI